MCSIRFCQIGFRPLGNVYVNPIWTDRQLRCYVWSDNDLIAWDSWNAHCATGLMGLCYVHNIRCSLRLLGSDAEFRHGSLSKAGNIRWMHTFITIIKTHYVNPAQGKAVLRQRTQMFDKHVPPPSCKRTKVLSTILHSGFTSGICISLYPQDSSGEIFWFPRQWNLKIIEKSSRGGSVEDGGDTVKRSCVGRARWWAHWREVCRARETEQRAGLTLFIFTGLFLPNMLAIDFYWEGSCFTLPTTCTRIPFPALFEKQFNGLYVCTITFHLLQISL